jgi:hypothetical protein
VGLSCRHCGSRREALRSTRWFCSADCRRAAHRARIEASKRHVAVAHQRRIREAEAKREPRSAMATLEACAVERVCVDDAKAIILRYEWLGTMPVIVRAAYGLRTPSGELAGAVVFGDGPGTASDDLCGAEWRNRAVCLQRGACVHWAHPHAASFLISRACRRAHDDFGWVVFYAYSDRMAGEVGVVYQSCNWRYVGVGVGRGNGATSRWRFFNKAEGRWYSTRMLRAYGFDTARVRASPNWISEKQPDKGRYVHFEGTRCEKRQALAALRYPVLSYPKR